MPTFPPKTVPCRLSYCDGQYTLEQLDGPTPYSVEVPNYIVSRYLAAKAKWDRVQRDLLRLDNERDERRTRNETPRP